ncbi:MAG: LysR family transcriptional regulator substrate-binding protein [Syntrophomonas sp.]
MAAQVRGLEIGKVSVGTSYSAYYWWLAKLIAAFHQQHPNIKTGLLTGNSSELCEAMAEHRADFCIINRREGDFDWIPLREDPMVAWVPAGHPMTARKTFPLAAFAAEPFIAAFPSQETDNARIFAQNHIKPNTCFTDISFNLTWGRKRLLTNVIKKINIHLNI